MNRDEIINQLFDNMSAAKRSIHSQLEHGLKRSMLSHTQTELLMTIRHLQPISFGQLAQRLQLTPGAVSQLADALEKHELIVREKDPQDRRIQRLRLSKRGEKQLLTIEKDRKSLLREIMEGLSDEELRVWLHIQQSIVDRAIQYQNTEKETK